MHLNGMHAFHYSCGRGNLFKLKDKKKKKTLKGHVNSDDSDSSSHLLSERGNELSRPLSSQSPISMRVWGLCGCEVRQKEKSKNWETGRKKERKTGEKSWDEVFQSIVLSSCFCLSWSLLVKKTHSDAYNLCSRNSFTSSNWADLNIRGGGFTYESWFSSSTILRDSQKPKVDH